MKPKRPGTGVRRRKTVAALANGSALRPTSMGFSLASGRFERGAQEVDAMRVLVIEDDRKVASFIQTGLQQENYAVDVLNDGNTAGDQAGAVDYDAVVLDLMLPGRSGFQVLRDIRSRKPSLPVLILTAKDSLEERVAGLDAGADDYMAKPFALAELSARLRALLRRGAPRESVLRVADLEMDTIRRLVRRAGTLIE